MGSRIEARTLKGFRDYLPGEMIPRTRMLATIEQVFQSYGFSPIKTPALEYRDVLVGKYGDEGDKLLYSFEDHGGRQVAMRYDLTVPLARVVAQHRNLEKPFRRYQIDTVWRAEKPGRGRFREFSQCDVDIIGSDSMVADAECLCIITSVLNSLNVHQFTIKVNNRKLLNGLLSRYGVDSLEKTNATLRIIDKQEKIGNAAVCRLLVEEEGWSASNAEELLDILARPDSLEVLSNHPETAPGAEQLREVLELARSGAAGEALAKGARVVPDLTVARGLDYYTGTIFETNLDALPGFGSVMSGGRYDRLLANFTGQEMPAVGVSLGVDRLLAGLQELGLVKEQLGTAPVLVTMFPGTAPALSMGIATVLRQEGLQVELYPSAAKLEKQFKYANRKGADLVVIAGPEEAQQGNVKLKVLATGEQLTVSSADAATKIKALLHA